MCSLLLRPCYTSVLVQVLAETGGATATAFEQIDKVSSPVCGSCAFVSTYCMLVVFPPTYTKIEMVYVMLQAPEEKARGITIATAHGKIIIPAHVRQQSASYTCPFLHVHEHCSERMIEHISVHLCWLSLHCAHKPDAACSGVSDRQATLCSRGLSWAR